MLSFASPNVVCYLFLLRCAHEKFMLFLSTSIPPRQVVDFLLSANPWQEGKGASEAKEFVANKLQAILKGDQADSSEPLPIDLTCTHLVQVRFYHP